jgi:hypothetical protein
MDYILGDLGEPTVDEDGNIHVLSTSNLYVDLSDFEGMDADAMREIEKKMIEEIICIFKKA